MEPIDGQLNLQITFDLDKIPIGQADIILQQFDFILNEIASSVDSTHSTFPSTIYSINPAKTTELASPVLLLHEFVEKRAAISPNLPAFQFVYELSSITIHSKTWTYKELDDLGNKVASILRKQGVHPQSLVGICFEKCPEAVFGIFGIMKASCAYVALDPQAPAPRKEYIIKETKASVVLTANREASYIPTNFGQSLNQPVTVVYLDEIDLEQVEPVELIAEARSQDLCYCLYTSGTTGNPKGCKITHENAVQAMRAFSLLFAGHWDDSSRWLQFASYHFDVSVLELFWSWSEGICVISAPRDILLSDLQGLIRRLEITHIDLTPSLAALLSPDEVPSLCRGLLITGGEALRQDILDKWGATQAIYNGYGPTEATIGVTMFPRVPHNGKPSNIGWQFENVGSYVFKPETQIPVLRGGLGELCVSGKLIGAGYLNDSILTEMKFQVLESNERVYRTGDQVRVLHNGSFEFLGRADEQVKLRGQRLEIDEINSIIKKTNLSRIIQAATYVWRHPEQTSKQLVSFVVLSDGPSEPQNLAFDHGDAIFGQLGEIRKTCQAHLPPYMIPTFVLPITHLPLTTNNKVARNILRTFFNSTSISTLHDFNNAKTMGSLELNPQEILIAQVVHKLFGTPVKEIFPYSNLFEFIDSISAIRFTRELKGYGFSSATIGVVLKSKCMSQLNLINSLN
jgi:ferricrocin synthase